MGADQGQRLEAEAVVHSATEQGYRLVVETPPGDSIFAGQLKTLEAADDETRGLLGNFHIGVYTSARTARALGFLPKDGDERGIVWRHHLAERGNPQYWAAIKSYANVQLIWWTDGKRVDERWERLDALLTGLVNRG